MTIAFRAATSTTPTSGSATITIPGSIQAGDLMCIAGGLNNGGDPAKDWTTPSGWTLKDGRDVSNLYAALYLRVAQPGDQGSTVTLPTSALGKSGVGFASWSGGDPSASVDDWDVRVENVSAASHATPAVDTTGTNRQIVIIGVQSDSAVQSWNTPSGYTKQLDVIDNVNTSGHVTVTIQDKPAPTVGSYGGESLVAGAASVKAVTWTLAITPASSTQTARPASDVSSSLATAIPALGAGESLATRLAANADTSCVEVQNGGYTEEKFSALVDPLSSSGHTIRYRQQFVAGATAATVLVEVREGGTVRASWTDTLSGTFTAFSHTLTSTQANSIVDYTDLRVRFTPTVS
ncbi:hypothetical protein [Actinomadura decatromicini]|uniref:Uncharacterized protein n=1 Tax=Actinomadura decatromicini TaxID=2604572 RepID=A0A5D3FCU1_9ACTN|nr:hypothetical protein [Actinomadura decatromicini]TYK45145.1 hypothetical protein FXF68_31180 [Actinomadura decatromicini]